MSAIDAVARMLTLVPWLLERPGASLAETAAAFGVGEDVIRSDLEHLDFCGLPGLGGGDLFEVTVVADRVVLRMADELRRPLRLTPREALRLVLTVDAVADALGDELPALRSAVAKVRAALGVPEGVAASVDVGPTTRWLADVRRAVRDGRQVALRYQGRDDRAPRRRVVDAWALQLIDGAWYLQGRDHVAGGLRSFRLDRAAAVEVLDAAAKVAPPDEPLPRPRYEPTDDDLDVVLRLAPGVRWVAAAVDADAVEEAADGGLTLRLRTDAPRFVARLALMAQGSGDVAAPPELRRDVRQLALEALARYNDNAER